MDLSLDPQIRGWVLIPLTVVMLLIGILRHFIGKIMREDPKVDPKAVRSSQLLTRARLFRAAGSFLPPRAVQMRRHYYCHEELGVLVPPKEESTQGSGSGSAAANMFTDPNLAVDMMKKNLSMIVPQTLTFGWVNYFFSGFVAAKIPFPLTQRFRGMLQNGIDLSSIDVTYVSSRSWYFLNLFGLRGVLTLILGDDVVDDTRMMQAQMMGGMGGMMGMDSNKLMQAEKDAADLQQFEWVVAQSENRALATMKRRLESLAFER